MVHSWKRGTARFGLRKARIDGWRYGGGVAERLTTRDSRPWLHGFAPAGALDRRIAKVRPASDPSRSCGKPFCFGLCIYSDIGGCAVRRTVGWRLGGRRKAPVGGLAGGTSGLL
jgi:hypothetical protein